MSTLGYFGPLKDFYPLELSVHCNDRTIRKRKKFKYKNNYGKEILKVLDKVQTFIYVDKAPSNFTGIFQTIEHFVCSIDVDLRLLFFPQRLIKFKWDRKKNLLHWDFNGKQLLYFYNTDWTKIKEVYKEFENINILYIKGFYKKGLIDFLPNVKTIITNINEISNKEQIQFSKDNYPKRIIGKKVFNTEYL